jgi:hypothetical protein
VASRQIKLRRIDRGRKIAAMLTQHVRAHMTSPRAALAVALAVGILALPFANEAQQATKVC